jgi:hypothetical protein
MVMHLMCLALQNFEADTLNCLTYFVTFTFMHDL